MKKHLILFPLFKALRFMRKRRFKFQVSSIKYHSTPLALWRGVGGEAFSLFILHSSFFTLPLLFTSCFRTETNGEFGGNWQMTEWTNNADQSVYATNQTLPLYYTVHRDLIKFQDMSSPTSTYYLATFHRTADSLVLEKVFDSPIDTIVPFHQLNAVGIDYTGRFYMSELTHNKMTLKNQLYTIRFRKY